ncbi:hypothetical protein NMG60_11006153 [Bertholletia excelsa]
MVVVLQLFDPGSQLINLHRLRLATAFPTGRIQISFSSSMSSTMQREKVYGSNSNHSDNDYLSKGLLTQSSRSPRLTPSQNHSKSTDFNSYRSIFHLNSCSLSVSPSDCSIYDDVTEVIDAENRLQQSRFILEYQQLYNRYTMCLAQIEESLKEVESLREENDNLQVANGDLVKHLHLLSKAAIKNFFLPSNLPTPSFIDNFNHVSNSSTADVAEEVSSINWTNVIRRNVDGAALPKSISVRSSSFLKISGSNGSPSGGNRVKGQVLKGSQQIYVPGTKEEEDAVELELCMQGMLKTELCNKWHEGGKCPYGENCLFAHGIYELRPVIRHPRYKTKICRVVLAGATCPYGHRCHFRHSLADQERRFGQL